MAPQIGWASRSPRQTPFHAGESAPTPSRTATVFETSIIAAKSTFILGIAGEGQLAYTPCFSTRRVAEHLSLPTRPLQGLVVQQR